MATSAVIGALRVNLAMDSAQFQQGAIRAQRQMVGLQTTTQNLQRAATGFNFRMLLPQLSQVAQQTTATGRPMQALAVQAADIGLAFGPLGIAIGAVAGLALPQLISALGGGATAAERFADASKGTADALGQVNSALGSVASLERDYRAAMQEGNVELANRIAKLIELRAKEAELLALSLPQKIREQAEAQRELQRQSDEALGAYEEALGRLNDLERRQQEGGLQNIFGGNIANEIRQANDEVTRLALEYAQASTAASVAAVQSEAMRTELELARGVLSDVGGTAAEVADRLGTASFYTRDIGAYAGAAVGPMNALLASARSVDGALYSAAVNAANLARAEFRLRNLQTGSTEDPRGDTGNVANAIRNERTAAALERYGSALTGVSGAAGGAARAVQNFGTVSEVLNRILNEFNNEQAREARENMQSIADDAIGGLGDAIGEFAESGFRDFNGLMDGMVDAAADAVAQITAEFASRQLASALGAFAGPVGGIFGALAGGLFGGLFGGGGGGGMSDSAQAYWDQRISLMDQWYAAMGDTEALRRRELNRLEPGNRALQKRVWALQDEAEIEAEKAGLEQELLQLLGKTGKLRKLELQTLDPSNRELQKRIWALEDEAREAAKAREEARKLRQEEREARQEARAEAREARMEAKAAMEAFKSERQGLREQLLTLLGETDKLRAMELAELDPANRALQIRIWALEDEKKAAEEAAAAAERLADSLSTSQFRSLFQYERAVGLARYGSVTPANVTSAPEITATGGATGGDGVSNTDTLMAGMLNRLTRMEQIIRKWDRDGQPPERAYA